MANKVHQHGIGRVPFYADRIELLGGQIMRERLLKAHLHRHRLAWRPAETPPQDLGACQEWVLKRAPWVID